MGVKKRAFKAAFPNTISIMAGSTSLGVVYGMLMETAGISAPWAIMMSAVAFCGSMQFAAVPILAASLFEPLQVLVLSLMINARHIFYGISMLEKYKEMGKLKGFMVYTLCDESFSTESHCTVPEKVDRKWFYFFMSLMIYFYWVAGTAIGSMAGRLITFDTTGLDFAMTALFIVLFTEYWKKKENRSAAAMGVLASLTALLVFDGVTFMIPAMLLMLMAVFVRKKIWI